MKKHLILLFLTSSILISARTNTFLIENPSAFPREDQPIVLTAQQFGGTLPEGYPSAFLEGRPIPVQADDLDRDGKPEEIVLTVHLKAYQKVKLKLKFSNKPQPRVYPKRVQALMINKVGENLVFLREATSAKGDLNQALLYHGPLFESERMTFRISFDRKQELVVFGKNSSGLLPPDPSTKDSLAFSAGTLSIEDPLAFSTGIGSKEDPLAYSTGIGIGTFKGWNGGKALAIEPVSSRTARILSEGPVRTVVEMESANWRYQTQNVRLVYRVVLYAGHRDLEIVNYLTARDVTTLSFCTGLPMLEGMSGYFQDHVLAVWGVVPKSDDSVGKQTGSVGLAIHCPEGTIPEADLSDSIETIFLLKGFPVIRYHVTAFFQKEQSGVSSDQEFFAKLPAWRLSLEERVLVRPKR
jgi:hypothetical protein